MTAGKAGFQNQIMTTGNLVHGVDANGDSHPVLVQTVTPASGTTITGAPIILGSGTASAGTVAVSNTPTIQTPLIAATAVAASAQLISSTITVSGYKKVLIVIDHGRASTAAFTTNGTEYRVEVSEKATGNDTWTPLASVLCASTACSSAISAGTAAPAAGASTIVITSGTALAIGDHVMWANTTSAASIEWATVAATSGTASFTVLDPITNAQGSTQVIYTQAEHFPLTLDVSAVTRLRVVVNNNASGGTLGIYSRVALISAQ